MLFFYVYLFGVPAQSLENEEKPEIDTSVSEEIKSLETAYALAEYGYANNSASALIEAAEILSQIEVQPLKDGNTKEGEVTKSEKPSGHEYTASQLADDGIKLAGKNKNLVAWGKEVKKGIKPETRGATRSPQWDVSCASRNGGTVRYRVFFNGGRYASVSVRSLDGCDYDLFIYDESGHLISQDVSYNRSAFCSFNPRWTGPFSIVVKNRSSYTGAFRLTTN